MKTKITVDANDVTASKGHDMGWVFSNLPAGQTVEQYALAKEFGGTHRVIAHAMVGDVLYTAVQTTRGDSRLVYGCVTLTQRQGAAVGFITMDETCDPSLSSAPARILDLLTPLDQWPEGSTGYAADWRARCRANLARQPTISQKDTQ